MKMIKVCHPEWGGALILHPNDPVDEVAQSLSPGIKVSSLRKSEIEMTPEEVESLPEWDG